MKANLASTNKLVTFFTGLCAAMLAFSPDVSAAGVSIRDSHELGQVFLGIPAVPDGGTTVMLLGTAIGVLAILRRFLMR